MSSLMGPPRQTRLSNGLQVLVIPQPQLHRAHVGVYVRVGSRFEDAPRNGISHFLEHMIYRGTERLKSAHEVNLAFERLGGYLYAATQTDFGVFSVTLPPESLAQATALFGEVLAAPAFYDIEIEKGIVCEEILEDLDDEGRQIDADNISRAMIYPTHPLGYTITGTAETVNGFHVEGLAAHHARHYTAANSVLVFSGDVDADAVVELAERHFSTMPAGERAVARAPVHTQKKPRLEIVENMSSQTELRVCFRAVSDVAPQRRAMDALMRIVDDGMSTRLYHRICDSQGLCYDVSAGFDGYEDDGIVDFAAGVQHARTTQVTREILALVDELASEGPTEEELTKLRQRHVWEHTALLDSAEELASFHANGLLFQRPQTLDERARSLASIGADDIRAAAALLREPNRLNVVAVGLLENDEDKRLAELVKGR